MGMAPEIDPDAGTGIFARYAPYLDRYVQLGAASGRALRVTFPDDADADADDHPLLDRILAYLDGVEDDFRDVDAALTMATDRRRVLESVRELPYGEDVTVEALVRMTADLDATGEGDLELARTALAGNPVPLLVPDHRVRDGPSGAPPEVEQRLRSLEGL